MDVSNLGSYRKQLVVLIIAIITAFWGCGRNNNNPSASGENARGQTPVDTEGFSFQYTGPLPSTYREAPELAKLVNEGKLPAVENRLPEEPLIIPPIERIGQYGGTWRRGFSGRADHNNFDRLMHDHLIYYDFDGYTLMPHIAKGWEVSEDGTTFTFHLRRGMKWSDGTPFTADDFVFAFNDIILNDKINPVTKAFFKTEGQPCKVAKIDETTVRYTFHRPNYVFIESVGGLAIAGQFANLGLNCMYAPRHYLKQFLPKFTPLSDLKEKMKINSDKNWVQLFKRMATPHENSELPVVGPWKMVTPITSEVYTLERNPYYFAVDTKGNQLPYISKISSHLVESIEVFNARAIAGEIDMQQRHILLDKVSVLKRDAEKGNYRVRFWPNLGGS